MVLLSMLIGDAPLAAAPSSTLMKFGTDRLDIWLPMRSSLLGLVGWSHQHVAGPCPERWNVVWLVILVDLRMPKHATAVNPPLCNRTDAMESSVSAFVCKQDCHTCWHCLKLTIMQGAQHAWIFQCFWRQSMLTTPFIWVFSEWTSLWHKTATFNQVLQTITRALSLTNNAHGVGRMGQWQNERIGACKMKLLRQFVRTRRDDSLPKPQHDPTPPVSPPDFGQLSFVPEQESSHSEQQSDLNGSFSSFLVTCLATVCHQNDWPEQRLQTQQELVPAI